MTTVLRRAFVAASLGLVALAAAAPAQDEAPLPPSALPPAAQPRDCSRWPASVYDEASGSCVCPSGMWWNLRGDACLPREHAAGEFCTTVWPGSEPYFIGAGGYRCVCAPPLLWDEQATACRPPIVTGVESDCDREWPGTLPVLSPSGTESECRCPGGKRWEEASRSCVLGAPVVPVVRGFPNEGYGAPAPPSSSRPFSAPSPAPPDGAANVPPTAVPPSAAPAPGPGGAVQGIPPPPRTSGSGANCDALLAEIRARAQAGQSAQADALGMRAAVAGCDPAAISEASRAPSDR